MAESTLQPPRGKMEGRLSISHFSMMAARLVIPDYDDEYSHSLMDSSK